MGLPLSPYLLACLIAPVAVTPTQPQNTAALTGTVRDAAGAPVPGATVRITSMALPSDRVTATDASGTFRLPLLPAGQYTILINKDGFQTLTTQIHLSPGEHLRSSFRLAPSAECVVEVLAAAASVDTTVACTGASYSSTVFHLVPGVSGRRDATPQVRFPSAAGNTESYARIEDNPFRSPRTEPLSTFSIDVDTASASNVRRFAREGTLPPADAVRIEELLNYFTYAYPEAAGKHPFAVDTEIFDCPWQPSHRLVRIGLQGKRIKPVDLPPRNLVFLIDVSGSMGDDNKLPLVKAGLIRLCDTLRPEDRIAMVVYAGSSGLVLEPTSGSEKARIQAALERLSAGGSTHGSEGIKLAYETARKQFRAGADNRVLLCTDGDFNVGVADPASLIRLIEEERKSGVFLTCLGFGMGNLKDATLEQLADKGNGHYAYIDSQREMEKVFGAGGGSLVTIAKDVKLQVEFNPSKVKAYRLIGYENRLLDAEDFNNDAKDAGEMNAGHSVTALYEVVPPGAGMVLPSVDRLKYQASERSLARPSQDLLTIKLRYKLPDGWFSKLMEIPVRDEAKPLAQTSLDSRWAASLAAMGMALRNSPHKGTATLKLARELGASSLGEDPDGRRREWLEVLDALDQARKPGDAIAAK